MSLNRWESCYIKISAYDLSDPARTLRVRIVLERVRASIELYG
jgi:hypothetical protein